MDTDWPREVKIVYAHSLSYSILFLSTPATKHQIKVDQGDFNVSRNKFLGWTSPIALEELGEAGVWLAKQ